MYMCHMSLLLSVAPPHLSGVLLPFLNSKLVQGIQDFLQHRCIKFKICDRASVYHIKACAIVKKLK